MNPVESLSSAGLRYEVPSFGPRLYHIFRKSGGAAGAITTHIDSILGCGRPDPLLKARCFLGRQIVNLKVEEKSFVRVGVEPAHVKDFSVTFTKKNFTRNLKPLPTSPELRGGRKEPLLFDGIKLRQCKLGDLCWVVAVSRTDICDGLARVASRISSLCECDVYRINELVREVREWQQMHRHLARQRHLRVTARPRMCSVIGKKGCMVVQCLRSDGRMLLVGTSRQRESAD